VSAGGSDDDHAEGSHRGQIGEADAENLETAQVIGVGTVLAVAPPGRRWMEAGRKFCRQPNHAAPEIEGAGGGAQGGETVRDVGA